MVRRCPEQLGYPGSNIIRVASEFISLTRRQDPWNFFESPPGAIKNAELIIPGMPAVRRGMAQSEEPFWCEVWWATELSLPARDTLPSWVGTVSVDGRLPQPTAKIAFSRTVPIMEGTRVGTCAVSYTDVTMLALTGREEIADLGPPFWQFRQELGLYLRRSGETLLFAHEVCWANTFKVGAITVYPRQGDHYLLVAVADYDEDDHGFRTGKITLPGSSAAIQFTSPSGSEVYVARVYQGSQLKQWGRRGDFYLAKTLPRRLPLLNLNTLETMFRHGEFPSNLAYELSSIPIAEQGLH